MSVSFKELPLHRRRFARTLEGARRELQGRQLPNSPRVELPFSREKRIAESDREEQRKCKGYFLNRFQRDLSELMTFDLNGMSDRATQEDFARVGILPQTPEQHEAGLSINVGEALPAESSSSPIDPNEIPEQTESQSAKRTRLAQERYRRRVQQNLVVRLKLEGRVNAWNHLLPALGLADEAIIAQNEVNAQFKGTHSEDMEERKNTLPTVSLPIHAQVYHEVKYHDAKDKGIKDVLNRFDFDLEQLRRLNTKKQLAKKGKVRAGINTDQGDPFLDGSRLTEGTRIMLEARIEVAGTVLAEIGLGEEAVAIRKAVLERSL